MREYRSPEWQAVKAWMIEMAEGRCERCGKSSEEGAVLQLHHHSYRPGARVWEYGIEELEVVCKGCHAVEHGIIRPWWGWAEDGAEDMGEPSQDCDVCGTSIRYVHTISRPGWGSLEVGSDCAERMCSDGSSEPEDLEIRRRVARRRTFLNSPRWQVQDRRHTIVQKSIEIELSESGGNRLRLALSWALWALGHLLSVPMARWDWAWLHSPYSRLMLASLRVQGVVQGGPWRRAPT